MAIPEGWTQRTIGELAVLRRGLTWRKDQECESLVSDSLPVLRIPNVQQRLVLDDVLRVRGVTQTDRERYRVSVGSSLLVGSNGNPQRVGNCVFIDHGTEFLFASFLIAASVANTNIEPGYLFRILASRSVQDSISEAVQGSTGLKNINLTGLREIPVNLPPLPEQKKIAAILSSVDEVIAKTEAVIAQLQIVKKAMMEQLLTKGMPDRHTRFKQTEIGEIPEEWEVVRAGELCEVITKGATPKVVTSASPDCVPFLRVQNIGRRGEIDLSGSALFVTERTHTTELMRSQIRPGDVLMNIVGPPLGKVAVVPISIPKANINQAIALLRPARIESEYLSLCLTAEHLFAWLLKQAKRTSTQLNLTLESCREFPLPLPDQAERREIIACTVAMQLTLDAQQTELVALREVKSSLSSSLLSGEIRVAAGVA